MGILLLTSLRSDKSPYGSTKALVEQEIEYLYPTISLPVSIVLFDLGKPGLLSEMGASAQDQPQKEEQENVAVNPVDTKAPDSPQDDFQEKMARIEKEGIPESGKEIMKPWRNRKKQPAPVPEYPVTNPAAPAL